MKELTIKLLKECQKSDDQEMAHIDADSILCNFLTELGYADVVAEYEKICKWYA